MADAVVIGAGVNGLAAAVLLADAGWTVEVFEAADEVGGACRSAELTLPGFTHDLFSAFYPFGVVSPVLSGFGLQDHGLAWSHAPRVLAHPVPGGPTAVLDRDPHRTAGSMAAFSAADEQAWTDAYSSFLRIRDPLVQSIFAPFPPVRGAARLVRALGAAELLRMARFAVQPARRYAEETFSGAGPGLLVTGNALHSDLGPDTAGSALVGWLLTMLGQQVGFPVPVGGAGRLSAAVAARARAAGARITTGARVSRILLRSGRAVGVRLADGTEVSARRAVIADVDAPQMYLGLVGAEHLPPALRADLGRFQWDNATIKVDWALSGPIPWRDPQIGGAGTVHLGGDLDALSRTSAQLTRGLVPDSPFLVFGQMTTSDPTRSPAGTETAWAYCHVPQTVRADAGGEGISGRWDEADVRRMTARMEAVVESYAPGFGDAIIGRAEQGPAALQASDAVLHQGALNGGSAAVHQQLFFRPVPGLGRSETPFPGLFLGSMSAHPGGGVHGGPGANAARAALSAAGLTGPVRTRALGRAQRIVSTPRPIRRGAAG